MRQSLCSILALLVLGSTSTVWARTPDAPWFTDLTVDSQMPLSSNLRLAVQAPGRVFAGFSLGVVPSSYVSVINEVSLATGGFDQQVADLIKVSLDDSLVLRADLGWQPLEDHGWYGLIAYRRMNFSGQVNNDQLQGLLGETLSERSTVYDVDSTLHMAELETGWRWVLSWGLTMQVGLGFSANVSAEATVDARFLLEDDEETASDDLTQIYRRYAFAPFISMGLGYRFR